MSGPIDATDELAINTTRVFRVTIQPAVERGMVGTIGVSADLPSDSWNVQALSVEALTEVDGDFIFSRSGNPLVRLTEAMPQVTFPL